MSKQKATNILGKWRHGAYSIHEGSDGRLWWADGAGEGECFIDEPRDQLIIGPTKVYGAAHHGLVEEAKKKEQIHQDRLKVMPEWNRTPAVVWFGDIT